MPVARFLSVKEFAEIVGVSSRTVSDLIAKGEVPVVRLGRRRLIPAAVVDMLEEQALNGTGTPHALGEAS